MVISMISVGEQTGDLDEMLAKVADDVVVGGMVVAMYLPIFDMINAVQ